MNDVGDKNSSERRTIDGLDDATSKRLALIRDKLSTLGELHSKMFALYASIERISTELQEISDSEDASNRCLGEESHHLLHKAKNIETALHHYCHTLLFVKDCISIRCNDSRVTKVCHRGVRPPVDYGIVIGDCLRSNTHVTELNLSLGTRFQYDYDVETIQDTLRAFFRFVGQSTSLRKVNVDCTDKTVMLSEIEMEMASLLLDAIGRNPCIEELSWGAYIPSISFRDLMLNTKSLKTLCIQCDDWQVYSRNEKLILIQSLATGRSRSVEHLDFFVRDNGWRMSGSVLHTLSQGTSPPLQHLTLGGNGRNDLQLRHLVPFLQSTTTLKHFEISTFDILVGHMNILLQGLQVHYERATSSITKLSFTSCSFDDEAAAMFIQFMQTPITSSDRTRPGGINLQELHLDVRGDNGDSVTEFAGVPLGSAIVSLVTTVATSTVQTPIREPDRQHTIGSQLRLLSVDPLTSMEGFCDDMKSQAANIHLPSLYLAYFGETECSELTQWLPYVQSLTELRLSEVEEDVDPCSMIMALQQSKSLRTITIVGDNGQRYLNNSNTRRIESICQRNQILFELLSQQTHVKWNNDVPDCSQHREKRQKTTPCDSMMYDDTETFLFPSLIQAAKYMPYTRASTIFATVLLLEMELLS